MAKQATMSSFATTQGLQSGAASLRSCGILGGIDAQRWTGPLKRACEASGGASKRELSKSGGELDAVDMRDMVGESAENDSGSRSHRW